jgi:hypothetical protein
MGDIVVTAFTVVGVLSVALLALGAALRSRPLLMLGGSLLASVILTWVLGLLGLPIGIVFGFLGTGTFLRSRSAKDRSKHGASPPR